MGRTVSGNVPENSPKRMAVREEFRDSCAVKKAALLALEDLILQAAEMMVEALGAGGKVMFFGNGGSAADAQHLAGEFVGKYRFDRLPVPAIALNCNTSSLTAIGNDFGYEESFARQVRAFARPGDVAVGISTSGNSRNVISALQTAKHLGCKTIGMTGENGGLMSGLSDVLLAVPSKVTPRIQECHITIGHVICGLVEDILFSSKYGERDRS